VLKNFEFERERRAPRGSCKEPIGVCGLITPWNWPLNQIACKVAPALAAGCTMVLKPSEVAPLGAMIFAEILHEAGVPKGVFNLVNGDGPDGRRGAVRAHPDIDMMSFTGSTRAGIDVAKAAAPTRSSASRRSSAASPPTSSWTTPTCEGRHGRRRHVLRQLRPVLQRADAHARAASRERGAAIAKASAEKIKVGDPKPKADTTIGPVVSSQFDKIQAPDREGHRRRARRWSPAAPAARGLNKGYFVRPTVFAT
jgi:aldehyde dehydrogenase (NAD+)